MWIKRRFIAQASTRMMDGWRNDVKCLKWDSSMQKIPNAPTEYDKIANDRQPVNDFGNDNWILCKASWRLYDGEFEWINWRFRKRSLFKSWLYRFTLGNRPSLPTSGASLGFAYLTSFFAFRSFQSPTSASNIIFISFSLLIFEYF